MKSETKGVILAIDDNPDNLELLFRYLDQAGFTALLAQNGENALKYAKNNKPDIILLDVVMPGIDGFEICRRLKQHETTKDIPVIFMTVLSDMTDKVKGFEVGGVDYITKPFRHEEVLVRVKSHLTIRNLQQELRKKNVALEQYVDLLAKKNRQLEELNTNKDRFFSILAHDLRDPFTGLLMLTQLITEEFDKYPRQKIKEIVMTLGGMSEALYALLDNLLTWSRVQRGMIEYHPQKIDIQKVITRNVAIFTSNAEQKQITLRTAIQERTTVYADKKMVDTVIRNLLSNALKFTHPGGNVEVSATQNGSYVTVSVTDTGIGIDEKHIPKLFRIDVQYKRIGTANEKGTGLGLILCQEFVERNGGKIWVESTVNKETTFRFILPQAQKAEGELFF